MEINKNSGTLFLAGTLRTNRNWTYTAGTVDAVTNNNLLVIVSTVTAGQPTFTGSHTLNRVTIEGSNAFGSTQSLTIASGTTLTTAGTLTFDNTLTGTISIITGTLAAQGDVTIADSLDYGGGSGTLLINGGANQTFTCNGTLSSGNIPILNINKTGGTLTLSGIFRTTSNWTYTAGTLDATTNNSTVVFSNTLSISGSHTLDNVLFNGVNSVYSLANSNTLTVAGTLTLEDGFISQSTIPAGGTVAAQGDVTLSSGWDGGTAALSFTGSANQVYIDSSSNTPRGNFNINKASGTVTLASAMTLIGTGQDLTIGSGTLNLSNFGLTVNDVLSISGTLTQGPGALSAGTITLSGGGTWSNQSSGAITVGAGGVSNGGTIQINGGAGACGADVCLIRSSTDGVSRPWTGAGTFTLVDVDVKNQGGTAAITAFSSTDSGGNGANWIFDSSCPIAGKVWGGGSNNPPNGSWNVGTNWTGDSVPGVGDLAIFSNVSAANCTINTSVSVAGINIDAGYTGTLTQGTGNTVTLGSSGFVQNGGTFTGSNAAFTVTSNFVQNGGTFTGANATITITNNFSLSAGAFTSTSGTLTVLNNFTLSGSAVFNHNSGTVQFGSGGAEGDSLISLVSFAFNHVVFNKGGTDAVTLSGTLEIDGNLTITSANAINGGEIAVVGNLTSVDTSVTGSTAITLDGTGNQTITTAGGAQLPGGTFTLEKTGGTATLGSDLALGAAGQDMTLASGNLDLGSFNLTVNDMLTLATTLSQGAGNLNVGTFTITLTGIYRNESTGDLTLGAGGVSNSGTIRLNGGGGGCGTDDIAILSSSNGVQRQWTGAGSFIVRDVDVKDQGGSSAITAFSSTNTGNNAANWIFNAVCPERTWGLGTNNPPTGLWNVAANWEGNVLPSTSEIALFSSAMVTDCAINTNVSVAGVEIASGYTGVVTQQGANTLTIGTSSYYQTGGTFVGGTGAIALNGPFTLNGGAFTAGNQTITVKNTWTYSGGTLDAVTNGGTVVFALNLSIEGTHTLGNVTFNGLGDFGSGSATFTFRDSDSLTVAGTLTLTKGSLNQTVVPASGTVIAQGAVTYDKNFNGDSDLYYNSYSGGPGLLAITGNATRTINLPGGALLPTITLNAPNVTLNGPTSSTVTSNGVFTVQSGAFVGGAGNLDLNAGLLLSGGSFTAPSGTLAVTGNFTHSGGTFAHNNGTIEINNTANQNFNITNATPFNHLTLDDNQFGYWKFDEVTGTSTPDSSTHGNTATLLNGPTRSTDVPTLLTSSTGSLSFDGIDDDITLLPNGKGLSGTTDFTVSTWVKTAVSGSSTLVAQRDASGGNTGASQWNFTMGTGGSLNFSVGLPLVSNAQFIITTTNVVINDNTWHHVVAVRSGLTGIIYADGAFVASATGTFIQNLSNTVSVNAGYGRRDNINGLPGNLDDIRIYTRALSIQEIQTLAAGGQPSSTLTLGTNLTGSGNLNIGSGKILDVSASNHSIQVAGNWVNNGTFQARNGTVTLNGASQTLSGSTSFYNLTKTVASAATLTFAAGKTQTVQNALTLRGGAGNILALRSSSSGTQWRIDPQGTRDVTFVNVQDSNNIHTTPITATSSGGFGNNTNWIFPASTLTWTGAASTDWGNGANWDLGYVPNSTDNVTIPSAASNPVLDTPRTINNLTLQNGSVLNLNANNFTVNGTFSNAGTLQLLGAEALNVPVMDTGSGTVAYIGTSTYSGLGVGNQYFHVTYTGVGGSWSPLSTLGVNGNLTIATGSTLDLNGLNLNLTGNWRNDGGFTAGNSTVTLNGTTQTIGGSAIFNNLTAQIPSQALLFEAGSTQTILGTLALNGQAAGTRITLRSSVPDTQWKIAPQGTRAIQFVDVRDSNNLTLPTISPSGSLDSGGNTRWFFAAPVANNDSYSAIVNTALNVTTALGVLANDTDVDGDTLSATGPLSGPSNGALTLNADGSFTYTPVANFTGMDSFTYLATDGSLSSNTATVNILVNVTNTAPTAGSNSYTVNEDTVLSVDVTAGVLANDTDPENNLLTVLAPRPASGPSNGVLTLNANGSFTYTPVANFTGMDSFTYLATDGSLSSNTATVTITVNSVNDAPSFIKGADQTVLEDTGAQSVSGWATAISAGPTDESGQTLNFIVSNDNNALFAAQPAVAVNGTLTYTPADNSIGSATVTVNLQDNGGTANGGSDTSSVAVTGTLKITVTESNIQLAIVSGPKTVPSTVVAGQPATLTCTANRTDVSWSWSFGDSSPAGSGDTVIHTYQFPGTYQVVVTCTDSTGQSVQGTLTLRVATVTDSDGDGFSDVEEDAAKSDPQDANSFPQRMLIRKLRGVIKYNTTGKDGWQISGTLPDLPAQFDPTGMAITLNVDGTEVSFTLDSKGKSKSNSGNFRLLPNGSKRRKAGTQYAAGPVSFQANIKHETWSGALPDKSIDQKDIIRTITSALFFNSKSYVATTSVHFSSKASRGARFRTK